ncbi:MAG: DUF3857 domain-containing protein [Bacteroidales bacterium]|nr:DUF3857 domain-containing protein [Bacteroidales bacterium]
MRLKALLMALLIPAAAIADNTKTSYDAIVNSYEATFTMTSAVSGELRVHKSVAVLNEDGVGSAIFGEYTDSFTELASFSGSVTPLGGKKTKLKNKDLISIPKMSGLVDDNILFAYSPSASYPFVVEYDYVIKFKKGIISFPTFFPVETDKVLVKDASFTLSVPFGTEISYCSSKFDYSREDPVDKTVHKWSLKDFQPLVDEANMPDYLELLPYVYSSPIDFTYGGYSGNQKDWASFGKWIYALGEGRDVLPEATVAKVKDMTSGCKTDFEKVKVLYDYLRKTTRYENISLGIGGMQPIEASKVDSRGFGDCKALSNYMKALLASAGIDSRYYLISTHRKKLLPGYVATQFNHIMLAVPLKEKNDTLWLECTNPAYPIGYRHSDCAGHDVLLIEEGEGKPVTIPSYPDSLSRMERNVEVFLSSDGSASLKTRVSRYLDYVESYINFEDLSPEKQNKKLSSNMKLHPESLKILSVRNNFNDYALHGKDYCPEVHIDFTMQSSTYANRSNGDRLFVPVNPIFLALSTQRAKRVNDIVIDEPFAYLDSIRVHLPAGYEVENVPEPVNLEDSWGTYSSVVRQEGDCVVIRQALNIRPCRREASYYDTFRAFCRKVNKAYDASFVIRKSN